MPTEHRPDEELLEIVEADPRSLIDTTLSKLIEVAGSEAGLLDLWDDREHRVSLTSAFGLTPEIIEQFRPLLDERLDRLDKADLMDETRAIVAADSIVARPFGLDELQVGKLRALALPLRSQGRLVGLLCLFPPSKEPTTLVEHPEIYDIIIDHVEAVLQNTRLIKRLLEEKRLLEAVVQQSADAILILGRDGRVLGFNPALTRLTGWQVEDVRGESCQDVFGLVTPDGQSLVDMLVQGSNADESEGMTELAGIEAACLRRDGTMLPIELSYATIRGANGEPLGAVLGVRDITARKEAEELQSTFLSIISHELQTPIAIIKGYAELLADQDVGLDANQLHQKMAIIREESVRLGGLVDKLLYASRIQAGGFELHREPLVIGPLCRKVVHKLAEVSPNHRITARVPSDLPPVSADFEALQEVLVNLIDNAIKYSPDGGEIVLEAEARGSRLLVSVSDEGIGVPTEERERIFERFSRARGANKRAKGTGLGLFICKTIVEAHGGRIWVEEAKRRGSRFVFSLPIAAPDTLSAAAEGA